MAKALIVIDYTNDFVADNGALTCGEPGIAIENDITAITQEFITAGDEVIFAVDIHTEGDKYHPETKLFPPHNIEGTEGRALFGKLSELYVQNQNQPHVHWMDKTRYSAFAGTNLDMILRERGITELHLVGVCTSICVLHTAMEAYNKGYGIIIHRNAVADFNPEAERWALNHFTTVLGAQIID
ncbi:cysteine hydrolase [Paenibacillus albiflavus]|uniref:Cysteine hydrolase n=1 Tax=Paenibacillus albiflavus TaxID=2545760 RepID=A0A4R4EP84_9BACL|nr:isochorismatase family cysteine hydrolase [Paenibacillus albiflavus]TCZ80188.1 cysteine hydrolase [Paenibacillus albiflavus]